MSSPHDCEQSISTRLDTESFSLDEIRDLNRLPLAARVRVFVERGLKERSKQELMYLREICSATGREVTVKDPYSGDMKPMLMFGSNNYLGFANDPYIKKIACETAGLFGTGIGGPPMLNGTTTLHVELEKRLAELKRMECAVIFPTGYAANLGWVTSLVTPKDNVLFDEYCHASFLDGLKINRIRGRVFRHNDMAHLAQRLEDISCSRNGDNDTFVVTEGVFSMDGDTARLDEILALKDRYGFILVVDDAHGIGVLGKNGHGIQELYDTDAIDIIVGTFSKTFAVTGGFVAASFNIAQYIRWTARPYIFSASLSPTTVASVLAGLDLLETEPRRVEHLKDNVAFLLSLLKKHDIPATSESAIVCIHVPEHINIRRAGKQLHDMGMFVNTIEYPAVPRHQQRFRISVMSDHTREDLARLVDCLETVLSNAC
jgi:8-amino-7-oxononanoate synthase